MQRLQPSPRITRLSWGHLEIEGAHAFRDAKLYPGGAREWDWRETGTHHVPGIQPADVAELLDHGAEVLSPLPCATCFSPNAKPQRSRTFPKTRPSGLFGLSPLSVPAPWAVVLP